MISYHTFTNPGNRDNNEDSLGMIEKDGKYLFVVCDGLGGHDKGEVASSLVVEKCKEYFEEHSCEETFLEDSLAFSQEKLSEKQQEKHSYMDMRTTVVELVIDEECAKWAHVGDTRLYHFVGNRLKEHTLDHSVPQSLVTSGRIKEKDIRNHPDRNLLLKTMGGEEKIPKYDLSKEKKFGFFNRKQAFLLCTDGFWELIEEKEMKSCLKLAKTPEDWIESMAKIVEENGTDKNMDNYTAIGVFCEV